MECRLVLPGPLSPIQNIIMNAWSLGVEEVHCACGTKTGKTFGAGVGLTKQIFSCRGSLYRWVAPIYAQSKIGMRYFRKLTPGEPYTRFVESNSPSMYVPDIDSMLEFWHGQNPESLEGEGVDGYAIDEAAKQKRQVYDSARTTVTRTRGPIVTFSTPLGKNWWYDLCMEAKDEMALAKRQMRMPRKLFYRAPTFSNPTISKEAIKALKRDLPDRLFRQYVLAEFLADGAVFSGVHACIIGSRMDFDSDQYSWFDLSASEATVVVGVDWAKTHDYAVFTAFCVDGLVPRVIGLQRFNGVKYTEAIVRLVKFCKRFKEVITVKHDKTGVGEPLDDMLSDTYLPYEGVTYTNSIKNHLVNNLMLGFQAKELLIPDWKDAIEELGSFEAKVTSAGNITYNGVGAYDDIVNSLMLGYLAAGEASGGVREVRTSDSDFREDKVGWYQRMLGVDDDDD